MLVEPQGYVPGDFCGPTAIAAITHAPMNVVMEACGDAFIMTESTRRPQKIRGMTMEQIVVTVELLTDVDQSHNRWMYFDDEDMKPRVVRDYLEKERTKRMYERKLLICGGYRENYHVAAVYRDQAVDTFSRGRIVPVEHLTMRRCLLGAYISFPPDLMVTQEALEKYGRSEHSACPNARRRAASSFR